MKIQVKFRKRPDSGLTAEEFTQSDVGIEVGKGVLAVFPGGDKGDGTCTMYPLDLIEFIHVDPEREGEGTGVVVPIRRDQH